MADESDDGFEPTMWWRVLYADGRLNEHGEPKIFAQACHEEEARHALASCKDGGKLQQLFRCYQWREQT